MGGRDNQETGFSSPESCGAIQPGEPERAAIVRVLSVGIVLELPPEEYMPCGPRYS